MYTIHRTVVVLIGAVVVSAGVFATAAFANHSWGSYHWARTASPFTLKIGDNVSSAWDGHLAGASADWNRQTSSSSTAPMVLNTTVVAGQSNPRNCSATNGRVEVCNSKYGYKGWLGIATIWASGSHITQGTVKLNDTYFNTSTYNAPAWRQFVVCQEVGHTFGLDHQDEVFTNVNLGTCMDYTNDPSGTLYGEPSNEHPNVHDYDQLGTIYAHLDSFTTVMASVLGKGAASAARDIDTGNPSEWGQSIRNSSDGRSSLFERDFGHGQKVFTFVVWAD